MSDHTIAIVLIGIAAIVLLVVVVASAEVAKGAFYIGQRICA
jgi:hypothetical protein